MTEVVTLAHIQNARQRIAPCVRRTPLTASAALSERLRTNVYVKLELFQKTGSFKVRGAFNKALGLTPEERGQGIVAVSGGNHAQAVAYAARTLALKSVVLMPETTPANYVDATRGYGAEIKFAANVGAAFAEVAEYRAPRLGLHSSLRRPGSDRGARDHRPRNSGRRAAGHRHRRQRGRRRTDRRHRHCGAFAQADGARMGRRDGRRGLHVEVARGWAGSSRWMRSRRLPALWARRRLPR